LEVNPLQETVIIAASSIHFLLVIIAASSIHLLLVIIAASSIHQHLQTALFQIQDITTTTTRNLAYSLSVVEAVDAAVMVP
jgi:hypothetical protein